MRIGDVFAVRLRDSAFGLVQVVGFEGGAPVVAVLDFEADVVPAAAEIAALPVLQLQMTGPVYGRVSPWSGGEPVAHVPPKLAGRFLTISWAAYADLDLDEKKDVRLLGDQGHWAGSDLADAVYF